MADADSPVFRRMRAMRPLQIEIIKTLQVKPYINPRQEIAARVQFLKEYLLASKANGYCLGISGGQDSTLAGKLAQMAVDELNEKTPGRYSFMAVLLPYGEQKDLADAHLAIEFIKPTRSLTINIQAAVNASASTYESVVGEPLPDYVKGNLKARQRMIECYNLAGHYGLLVIGTDHAAEAVTGFFTKYGDGGCDIQPLFGLTKQQGKELLAALQAPTIFSEKTPTADLLDGKPGRPDEDELGISYQTIDAYLCGEPVDEKAAAAIEARYLGSMHKRCMPLAFTEYQSKQRPT
jgi:NAD+ synthase